MKQLINHIPILLMEREIEINWDGEEGTANGSIQDLIYLDWACSFDYIITASRQIVPAIFDSPAEAHDMVYDTYILNLTIYRNDNELNPAYIDNVDWHKLTTAIEQNLKVI